MDLPKAPGGPDEAPSASRLVIGCMKHAVTWQAETSGEAESAADFEKSRAAIQTGLSLGVRKFDHADIYCRGRSEAMFPLILKDLGVARESLIIQGKCGMVYADDSPQALGKQYDLSYDHIVSAVEGSLRRLGTGYLDVLLLHRPDPLAEPEEIAHAFDRLHATGAVRQFGVSNHGSARIDLLRRHLRQPLVVNQVALHLLETTLIDAALPGSNMNPAPAYAPGGTLDYCRLHDIQIEAWAPLAGGLLGSKPPPATADERVVRTHRALSEMAAELGVENETLAIAWLLRHPARIRPILGTRDLSRIRACAAALDLTLTRQQWFRLYDAARGRLLH